MVKIMTPTSVKQAAEKARLQELALEAIFKKHKVPYKPSILAGQYGGGNARPLLTWHNQQNSKTTINNNGSKENLIEQRRQLGLCFKCGEKYGPGHQCKRQLMNMEGADGEKMEEETETGETTGEELLEQEEEEERLRRKEERFRSMP